LIDDEDAVVRAKVRIAYSILHMARPAGGPPLRYPPWPTDDDGSMIDSHSRPVLATACSVAGERERGRDARNRLMRLCSAFTFIRLVGPLLY